jgi:hypothetical protein
MNLKKTTGFWIADFFFCWLSLGGLWNTAVVVVSFNMTGIKMQLFGQPIETTAQRIICLVYYAIMSAVGFTYMLWRYHWHYRLLTLINIGFSWFIMLAAATANILMATIAISIIIFMYVIYWSSRHKEAHELSRLFNGETRRNEIIQNNQVFKRLPIHISNPRLNWKIVTLIVVIVSITGLPIMISIIRFCCQLHIEAEAKQWLTKSQADITSKWTENDAIIWLKCHGFKPRRGESSGTNGHYYIVSGWGKLDEGGIIIGPSFVRLDFLFDMDHRFSHVENDIWPLEMPIDDQELETLPLLADPSCTKQCPSSEKGTLKAPIRTGGE